MAAKDSPAVSEPITNIVLVGKTGNGKSATGNTVLGQKFFTSKKQAGGVTMKCEMYRAAIPDGPIINVIDTPGMCSDPSKVEHALKQSAATHEKEMRELQEKLKKGQQPQGLLAQGLLPFLLGPAARECSIM